MNLTQKKWCIFHLGSLSNGFAMAASLDGGEANVLCEKSQGDEDAQTLPSSACAWVGAEWQ